MSRGLIIGIVCLTIVSTSATTTHAQEASSEGPSGSLTLSERLTALRDKFRREESEAVVEDNSSSRASRPSYGTPKRRTSKPTTAQSSERKSILPSINASSLLPSSIFGRKKSDTSNDQHPQAYDPSTPIRVAAVPRIIDQVDPEPSKTLPARKSPTTARTNELEAALADLVPEVEQPQEIEAALPIIEGPAGPLVETTEDYDFSTPIVESNSAPTPAPSDAFDLHEALLGDIPVRSTVESHDAETFSSTDEAQAGDQEPTLADEEAFAVSQPVDEPSSTFDQPSTATSPEPSYASEAPVAEPTEQTFAAPSPVTVEPTGPIAGRESSDPFENAALEAFSAKKQAPKHSSVVVDDRNAFAQDYSTEEDVLFSYQQPVIVSHVEGPRRIMVGREATYQIRLENTSNTKAKLLAASIRVPEWAEVVDAMSSSGVVQRSNIDSENGVFKWKLDELAAQSSESLRLRLIPRNGRPLQLGVEWSQAPIASETMVEVQEPKLKLEVGGPEEVLFGKPQRYRLTISNPGTGQAERVVIQLIPPGGTAKTATTQPIGTLKPGEVRDLDLELTAREAGELTIQASATAEGGLSADSVKEILCQKPELQLDWRGPETKYAGTLAAYYFRVRNPGTASTEPVTVRVELPEGTQFIAASDGHKHDPKSNSISWRLPSVEAGQEQFMQVRCKVEKPGANNFDVIAQTVSGDLSDTKSIQTNVVALADLKLEVTDPQGPLPMDESVVYEIRVRNRGTTAAENVSIVGLFSTGIEPTSVEGAQYTIRDGRVTFNPIQSLPAGREAVLRIRATANQAGTHLFRAEVTCQDLDIKLAAEETTRFFEDEYRWEDSSTPYSAERNDSVSR